MKLTKKIIAVLLTILTLFTTCSVVMPVFAEYEWETDYDIVDDMEIISEEAEPEIISEITEKRQENTKYFLMSDGSFMVAQYSSPVHYLDDDGEWTDYNNSLSETEASQEQSELFGESEIYITGNKAENVVFAPKSNSNTLVSYEAKDYPISLNYQSAKKSYIIVDDEKIELKGNDAYLILPDVRQEVLYEDVFNDVDLQYIVNPGEIKENIILKSKNSENTFTVNYNIGVLNAEVIDSKTINLVSGENVVYTISAPYMYDAVGAMSEAVTLTVNKNKNGKLRVVITADSEWLQSEDRVYPVVVDPSIVFGEIEHPESTFVSSSNKTTNYDSSNSLYISDNNSTYGETYALFKLNPLVSDLNVDYVVSAKLMFSASTDSSTQVRAQAYEATTAWSASTVTWNSKPSTGTSVIDVMGVDGSETIILDFTKLYSKWIKDNSTNNGIVIKALDSGTVTINTSAVVPTLTLQYLSTAGLDDGYSYTEFDMGTAGSVYVNNLSGNLIIFRDEIDTLGENYSYDFTNTYNSFTLTSNRASKWLRSYESGFISESEYIDSDGSLASFDLTEATVGSNIYTVSDNDFGWEKIEVTGIGTYDAWTNDATEKYSFDANGLVSQVVDIDTANNTFGTTVFSRANAGTNSFHIIDGDGERLLVTDSTSQYSVAQINSAGTITGDTLIYTYSGGNVSEIKLNGDLQAKFTYDTRDRIETIENDVGYKLTFTYDGKTDAVSKVVESKGSTMGQTVAYERAITSTNITTAGANGIFEDGENDDVITTYKFNNNANLIGTYSETASGEKLGAVSYEYSSDIEDSGVFGDVSRISSVGINPENMLKNHNLESASDWSNKRFVDSAAAYSATVADIGYIGRNSLKLNVTNFSTNGVVGYYQTFNASDGRAIGGNTYVASAYVKTDNMTIDENITAGSSYGAFLMIELVTPTKTTRYYSAAVTATDSETDGGWERVYRSIDLPTNYTSFSVALVIRNAKGTAYFDCPQLELGDTPSLYNLIENNSFSYDENNWTRYNLDTADGVLNSELTINGTPGVKKGFYQDIELGSDAEQSDSYIMSAWAKASAIPYKSGRYFAIYPIVFYDSGYEESKSFIRFDYNDEDLQFVSAPVDLATTDGNLKPVKIRFLICYYRQGNAVTFDNISLVRSKDVYDFTGNETEGSEPYTYNDDGSIATYTNSEGVVYAYTYDYLGNVVSILNSSNEGDRFTYNYYNDSDGDGVNESSEIVSEVLEDGTTYSYTYYDNHELKKDICVEDGITHTTEYDINGNVTKESESGIEDGTAYIVSTEYAYDSENRVISQSETDKSGKTITYTYTYEENNNISTVSKNGSLIEQNIYDYHKSNTYSDRIKTETTYVPFKGADDDKSELILNYDLEGNITDVKHNGFFYYYDYDGFGNTTNVAVGSQSLITYNYLPDRSNISSVQYGNGSTVSYTYNAYGEVANMTRGSLGSTEYRYSSDGKPMYVKDTVSDRKTYNWYDIDGNHIGEKVFIASSSNTQDAFLYSYVDNYDEDGNVIKTSIKTANNGFSTSYTYNDDGLVASTLPSSSRSKTYTYDNKQRITETKFSSSTTDYVTEGFTYHINGLVKTHTVGSDIYSYEYNENGNITQIKKNNSVIKTYTYDVKNQLISENNIDLGTSTVYTYDGGGNIKSKTTGSTTVNYTYDSTWKDKLIAYNGQSITYDAIGNPLNYMGATMTWFGREMQSYSKNGTSITYKYDEDGLRTQKVINGVEHNYYYVDGLLRTEEIGDSYIMNYRYDPNGTLVAVSRSNLTDGSSSILFAQTNTRGDVVSLYNSSGVVKVNYVYDSWGKLISATDGNGNALAENSVGSLNSIRYRGYVYDSETGLYYLQSRYYDPEVCRFINSDDVNFIGATGTVSSYNVFAYCENNAVNGEDPTGLFYKEDHREETREIAEKYFSKDIAEALGEASASVDDIYSPTKKFYSSYNQSFHFNTNSVIKKTDSRQDRSEELFKEGVSCLARAKKYNKLYKKHSSNNNYRANFIANLTLSVMYFGMSIHPLQDQVAHSGIKGDIPLGIYFGSGSIFVFHLHWPWGVDELDKPYPKDKNKIKRDVNTEVTTKQIKRIVKMYKKYGLYSYVK
jgi:RHS repeat-associated protein